MKKKMNTVPAWIQPWINCNKLRESIDKKGGDGSRSSKTTDKLNSDVIDLLKIELNPANGWVFKPEHRIPCSRGDLFKVDIAIYKENRLVAVLLLKSIQKSYNKNRHNYANTLSGEVERIKSNIRQNVGTSIITIDWLPHEVPSGEGSEMTNPPDTSSSESMWNEIIPILNKDESFVSFNKIRFTYNNDVITNIRSDKKGKKEEVDYGIGKLVKSIRRLEHA